MGFEMHKMNSNVTRSLVTDEEVASPLLRHAERFGIEAKDLTMCKFGNKN